MATLYFCLFRKKSIRIVGTTTIRIFKKWINELKNVLNFLRIGKDFNHLQPRPSLLFIFKLPSWLLYFSKLGEFAQRCDKWRTFLKNSNSFSLQRKRVWDFSKLFRKNKDRKDKENNGNALFLSLSKEEYTDRWNNNDPYI